MAEYLVRAAEGQPREQLVTQLREIGALVVDGSWDEAEQTCRVVVAGDAFYFWYALTTRRFGEILDEL